MLWIVKGDESHEIISCNIHEHDGKHQLWVERPNGKTMKVYESVNKDEVVTRKEMIDYAVNSGARTVEI